MPAPNPPTRVGALIARVGYPLVVGGGLGATWALGRERDVVGLATVIAGVSVGSTAIVALWEWLRPAYLAWARDRRDAALDLTLTVVMLPVLVVLAEATWRALLPDGLVPWPTHWPLALQVAGALLIAELAYYGFHILCHRWAPLWRLHLFHHAASRVWWGNSGRFHPVDAGVGFLLYFLPLVALGAPPLVIALIVTLNTTTGLLEHANVEIRVGVLNRVFNTAELHRAHHAHPDTAPARNLGKVLSVWDTVFGTYHYAPEPPRRIGADGPWPWPLRWSSFGESPPAS